ncbi:MAG TPA: diphosphomevalonate decarboxylase [Patescibacteria group bacterium]|jgi:diphosphomevalonate decarboxylase
MKKTTFRASSDVALIKYWGKKDEKLRLPANDSLSMVLDGLHTTTTVEFQSDLSKDIFVLNNQQTPSSSKQYKRVVCQLDLIRNQAELALKAKVVSQNNFPTSTGLSSSGSGMAALTCAAVGAAGLRLSSRELSILARQGSGSACRCVCGGFVEWHSGKNSATSFAETLHPHNYWDLRDVVAVVGEEKKKLASTAGHVSAKSSSFYQVRQQNLPGKLRQVKQALADQNFSKLGELIEAEALEFHSILLTSLPSIIALLPGSIAVMRAVQQMREEGILAYFTVNTGFNVHVLTLPEHEKIAQKKLANLSAVKKTLTTKIGTAPKKLTKHLF